MPDSEQGETAALRAGLRAEADTCDVGPAPVDAVLRRGRRLRGRRRAAVLGTALAVVAVPLTVLDHPYAPLPHTPLVPPASAPPSSAPPHPSGKETDGRETGGRETDGSEGAATENRAPDVEVVQPGEPVALAPGTLVSLLAEGEQNYVVSSAAQHEEAVRSAREYAGGDNIRPDSISGGSQSEHDRILLLTGAWRLPGVPSRVTVTAGGARYDARILVLPGDPGWGVYCLDTEGLPGFADGDPVTVTARDADGKVFDTLVIDPGTLP